MARRTPEPTGGPICQGLPWNDGERTRRELDRLYASVGAKNARAYEAKRPSLEDLEADRQAAHDGYNPNR